MLGLTSKQSEKQFSTSSHLLRGQDSSQTPSLVPLLRYLLGSEESFGLYYFPKLLVEPSVDAEGPAASTILVRSYRRNVVPQVIVEPTNPCPRRGDETLLPRLVVNDVELLVGGLRPDPHEFRNQVVKLMIGMLNPLVPNLVENQSTLPSGGEEGEGPHKLHHPRDFEGVLVGSAAELIGMVRLESLIMMILVMNR